MSSTFRLEPPRFHSRWYHLRKLRIALEKEAAFLPSGGVLLDFGCADMPYRPVLEPVVRRYIGADLPRNSRAEVHLDNSGRVAMPDKSVDIVLSSQVLEHVPSPQRYLAEAVRLLKPQGTLLLSTHGYWKYHPDPTDFWRWTRDGLMREIEDAGFDVRSIHGVMGLGATGLQLFQDGVSGGIPRLLRPIFFYVVNRSMALVDWLTSEESRNLDACVFVVRASKGRVRPDNSAPLQS